jgi:hypothetical protein
MSTTTPQSPIQLSPYALACLESLAQSPLGGKLSLGGAVGLMHYLEYRTTYDVDAWWLEGVTVAEQDGIRMLLEATLAPLGTVQVRRWGDVLSVELMQENKTVFSFQIAHRSALLYPPQASPWGTIWLDTLADLIASKMVALVERGAPRDFRDIYALCQANLTTPATCWQLWQQRQVVAQDNSSGERAQLAIETHLARIERQRPLNQITEAASREAATAVRQWFKTQFLPLSPP